LSTASARASLFDDALSCEEVRATAFLPGAVDDAALATLYARAEALLHALAVVEDGLRNDDPDQPSDQALHRLEAKVDLLMGLVAGLCASIDDEPSQVLLWSARGACILTSSPLPVGAQGRFRVKPADWLPSPLVLPAAVLANETTADGENRALLGFGPLSPGLQAALERHLFRVHRRAIAESRRPR